MQEETERYYTVEEANRELDGLRAALARIREARETLLRSARVIRRAAPGNGGGPEGVEQWTALRTLRQELEAVAAKGIVLRDAERGLIDFPSRREGRLVYLCWQPDEEERIGYWHEANTGFTGRKPLGTP